jgi:hypothetical protein
MSSNPLSFRLPLAYQIPEHIEHEGKKIPLPPQIRDNVRMLFNGLQDLRQAITSLNGKVGANTTAIASATSQIATVATGGGGGVTPSGGIYVVAGFNGQGQVPQPNQIILRTVISGDLSSVVLPINLFGSFGGCLTAPTGSVTISLVQTPLATLVPVTIATMSIAAGANIATFAMAVTNTLLPGDILDFVMQAGADPTFAGIFFSIVGTRS